MKVRKVLNPFRDVTDAKCESLVVSTESDSMGNVKIIWRII